MPDTHAKSSAEPTEREAAFRAALEKASLTIRQLLEENASLRAKESIAVIGMACRFPGGANSPDLYWDLLKSGRDAISEVPASRWRSSDYLSEDRSAPGRMYCARAGFLDIAVDQFDAGFFGISPKEANALDPQQRLLLEVSWEAIEHARIAPDSLKNTRTAVYVGLSGDDYARHHRHSGNLEDIDAYSLTGSTASTAAGRISYTLGLHGPCLTLDTACSSSLIALHLATRSLRAKESDMALVGGVNLILSPEVHVAFSKLQAISPDGKCRTFDASANGYVRSEGCAVVLLKREADALRDGDRIFALIKGTATNQDGKTSGLAAPSGPAQQAVIKEALADAGLQNKDIDYVEAHGTGTSLGDPIEVEALAQTVGSGRSQPLKVGSAKSNIGHMEPVAGLGGLFKIILSLQHEAIPGNLHFNTPNPHIMWGEPAIEVISALSPWPKKETPRYAGLSAFGFSGSNAHIIVAEAPAVVSPAQSNARDQAVEQANAPYALYLSARSAFSLRALAERYASTVASTPDQDLHALCVSTRTTRATLEQRIVIEGSNKQELVQGLRACAQATSLTLAPAWSNSMHPAGLRKMDLPLYAFDRQRYWSRLPTPQTNVLETNAYQTEWVEQTEPSFDPSFNPSNPLPSKAQQFLLVGNALNELAHALTTAGRTTTQCASVEILCSDLSRVDQMTDLVVQWPDNAVFIQHPEKFSKFCESVVTLARVLATRATPSKLWVISQAPPHLQVTDGQSEAAPFAFAAEGLLRSVFLEYPVLRGGVLNLGAAEDQDASTLLNASAAHTLQSEHAEVSTLFISARDSVNCPVKTLVKRLRPVSDPIRSTRKARADATYLITGGHGALGLQAAKALAEQGAGKIVLLSRTPPSESVRQTLETLRKSGCLIQSEAVDITHAQQLSDLIARLKSEALPLRGIIHAAGVMRHDAIAQMTPEAMDAVMLPKALGAWHLHALTQEIELDCFVLYGSISSLLGTNGLSHYTAANAFLNGLAQYRQQLGLPAVSINWGPWPVGGMVDAQSLAQANASGFAPLDPSLTEAAMSRLFFSDIGQIAVVQADWARVNSLFETRCPQPILSKLIATHSASANSQPDTSMDEPATAAQTAASDSALKTALTELLESDRHEYLALQMQDALAKVLQFPASQRPDRSRGFFDMGMDSISSVEFRLSLETLTAKTLAPSIVFDYPTIDALATHLLGKLFTHESVLNTSAHTQPMKPVVKPATEQTKIEDLSEEELALLIDQELEALNQMDTPR